MQSFTTLKAWSNGLDLVKEVYCLANTLPKQEQFALASQLRRASSGILANIAEGYSRASNGDKSYKYAIARGECSETQALLHITVAVGYLEKDDIQRAQDLANVEGKLLSGLIRKFHPNPSPNLNPSVR